MLGPWTVRSPASRIVDRRPVAVPEVPAERPQVGGGRERRLDRLLGPPGVAPVAVGSGDLEQEPGLAVAVAVLAGGLQAGLELGDRRPVVAVRAGGPSQGTTGRDRRLRERLDDGRRPDRVRSPVELLADPVRMSGRLVGAVGRQQAVDQVRPREQFRLEVVDLGGDRPRLLEGLERRRRPFPERDPSSVSRASARTTAGTGRYRSTAPRLTSSPVPLRTSIIRSSTSAYSAVARSRPRLVSA